MRLAPGRKHAPPATKARVHEIAVMVRTLLYMLLLVLAVFFIFSNSAQFEAVLQTFRLGNWGWLLLAAVLELVWLVNMGTLYRAIYRVLGMEVPLRRLIPVTAAAIFSNVLASSVGSLAIYIDDARRHNLPTGRVTLATLLTIWVEYMAFIAVLSLGFGVLFRRNSIELHEVIAAVILIAIAIAFGLLLLAGMHSAQRLEAMLVRQARLVNRIAGFFIRRDYLSEAIAHRFAEDTAEAFRLLRKNPQSLWLPFALALSARALHISILFLMFLAFKQAFSTGTLIASYSLATLFTIVSITPGGVAIVESVMVVTLRSLRVPLAAATVITLAYRGLTFWLPFGLGFIAIRLVQPKPVRERP